LITSGGLFESSPNLHCEIKSRIILEQSLIEEEFITGALAFPNGLHAAAIYGFKDGFINKVRFARQVVAKKRKSLRHGYNHGETRLI